MTLRRVFALLLAGLALAWLASGAWLLRDFLRERLRSSLPGVANGTVVSVEPEGEGFSMVVEYEIAGDPSAHRLRAPAESVGLLGSRPGQQPGDPVLVAYDPRDLSSARVFAVRAIWRAVFLRSVGSVLLLVASVFLFRVRGRSQDSPASQPPA